MVVSLGLMAFLVLVRCAEFHHLDDLSDELDLNTGIPAVNNDAINEAAEDGDRLIACFGFNLSSLVRFSSRANRPSVVRSLDGRKCRRTSTALPPDGTVIRIR
jgi:hypothetical protein